MSALAKEVIFEELRKYHQEVAPTPAAAGRWTNPETEFADMEDRVITMLIRLVNGKEIFADAKDELTNFSDKISGMPASSPDDETRKVFFVSKTAKLQNIVNIARQTDFPLRKLRIKKTSTIVSGKKS